MPVGVARRHALPRRPAPPPGPRPGSTPTSPSPASTASTVVLVDDVLYSGRTVRAALDAMNDLGRPDVGAPRRAGRPRPPRAAVRADHVGKNLPSARTERVMVRLEELDGLEEVRIAGEAGDTGHPDRGRPREEAPALHRRRHCRRHRDPLRHGRGDARRAAPAGQEAARAARTHRDQPVLRGLHAHPLELRDRRQVALGRHDQHHRQGQLGLEGREPARHRAHDRRDGRRRPGDAPRRQRRGAAGLAVGRRQRHQRRRRHPRAPHPGPARRLHAAAPRSATLEGRPRRAGRRPHAQPGLPQQRAAAAQAGCPGHGGRPADADAERRGRLVGRATASRPAYDLDEVAAQRRRADDAARAARADERRVLPQRTGVHRGLRADPRAARDAGPRRADLPPRADEPRPRDRRRRRRRRPVRWCSSRSRPASRCGCRSCTTCSPERTPDAPTTENDPTTVLVRGASLLGGDARRPAAARRRGRRDRHAVGGRGRRVVDADGLVALPGLVDLHTHLREPGREDAETVLDRVAGRGGRRATPPCWPWPTPAR